MSALTDAIRILNDESAVFSFLPAVNYLYFFTNQENPATFIIFLTLSSLFLSSLLYNALTEINLIEDNSGGERVSDLRSGVSMLVIGVLWVVIFGDSVVKLYTLFGPDSIWPELLSAVSILFIFLLITDLILFLIVPAYSEN